MVLPVRADLLSQARYRYGPPKWRSYGFGLGPVDKAVLRTIGNALASSTQARYDQNWRVYSA